MAVQPQNPASSSESRAALEDIGHLTLKICAIWGTEDLDTFLSKLVMDARDGERRGLPVAVATEILFLAQVNKRRRAIDLGKKMSMDPDAAYRLIDEEDQARLRIDPFDDPSVSRDTVITRTDRGNRAPERQMPTNGSQIQGLWELLLMMIRSKWLVGAIVLVLGVKLVWPIFRPFF
ncbi:MAG: hypothetical protein KBF58_13250 [Methyloversatilis sp.]|nr:hypothetical protein [Methyloversatilis sp.]